MREQNQVLVNAVRKLALAGEQAGFSVEEMIEILNTGVTIDVLLDMICCRLQVQLAHASITTSPQTLPISEPEKFRLVS